MPQLSSAVDKLRWNNGTEADAARLLSIVHSLSYSRSQQSAENYQALPALRRLLRPIWEKYPVVVTASACLYCGNHYSMLSGLMEAGGGDGESLRALASGHPRLLESLQSQAGFPEDTLYKLGQLHAELSSAGDAKTAVFIGHLLAEKEDFSRLELWVSKGLNGGRSLEGLNLDSLPREVVVAAWQRGVRLGYDQAGLSRYLTARGFRPALRWVVWLQGSELDYLQGWGYQREQGVYQDIVTSYTDFPPSDAAALARHYSGNWQTIHWDSEQQRWRSL